MGAGDRKMNAHKTTAQIVKLMLILALVSATMMTSGCIDVRDAEYMSRIRFGRIQTSLGRLDRKKADGSTTSLTNPFAPATKKNGGVENIMD